MEAHGSNNNIIPKVNDVQGSSAWGCTHSGHVHALQGELGLA